MLEGEAGTIRPPIGQYMTCFLTTEFGTRYCHIFVSNVDLGKIVLANRLHDIN